TPGEQLNRYRALLALGAVLYPAWGLIMTWAVPGSDESFGWRWILAAVCVSFLALSFRSQPVERQLERVFFALGLAITLHTLYVVQLNHLNASHMVVY